MNTPPAISGEFSTFKHVPTRKVYQLIIEIPSEAAEAMFATLGTPGGSEQITVGIARVDLRAKPPVAKPEPAKERRPFSELPYSQQSAMRCNEPGFLDFIAKVHPDWLGADNAAQAVRDHCGVRSRADLDTHPEAAARWLKLDADFFAWSRGMR